MRKQLLVATAALCVATAASAQPYPANGYIGVFSDPAGTLCCSTVPAFVPTNLYVVGFLAGETAGGVTGAEFRLHFTSDPTGSASITFVADPAANVVIGNPIDLTPGDPATGAEGVNIAWPMCQAGPSLAIGTLQVIIFNAAWTGSEILTKQRTPAGNPEPQYQCPLFTLCDAEFTKICLTIPAGAEQSVIFRSGLNLASCNTSCTFVGVEQKNWTAVKDLYR